MDFVGGNLDEYLHPEKHTAELAAAQGLEPAPASGGGGEGAAAGAAAAGAAAAAAAPAPSVPPQTRFNPNMKFGPAPGERPHFRLTIATPRLGISFEAHPREWSDPAPAYTYVGPEEAPWLRPFLRAQVRGRAPPRCSPQLARARLLCASGWPAPPLAADLPPVATAATRQPTPSRSTHPPARPAPRRSPTSCLTWAPARAATPS